MKNTKQKEVILAAVLQSNVHPTADEIYTSIREQNPTISLGTVYRNLNRFAEKGKIRKVVIPNGSDRFDFRIDSHEHAICEVCNNVFDVEIDENMIYAAITCNDDVKITRTSLTAYGICKECEKKVTIPAEL